MRYRGIPRSERFDDPYRGLEYRLWKLKRKSDLIEKATELIRTEGNAKEKSTKNLDYSNGKDGSNPCDKLNALMSSSSDDDDVCKEQNPTTRRDKPKRNSSIKENSTIVDASEDKDNYPQSDVEVLESLPPENSINRESVNDGEIECVNDEIIVNENATGGNDNDGYYEGPALERKPPHHLSKSTLDSQCFVDNSFFPEADTKVYSSIHEARRELMDYGVQSELYISIRKSSPTYVLARCISHIQCPCYVQIGLFQNQEGTFKVKKIDRRHANTKVLTHGPGGRKLKQRNRIYADSSYKRVSRNVASRPRPKDVEASARNEDGIAISYLGAYRIVSKNRSLETIRADKFYQKLDGFMAAFAKINLGSVVDVTRDEYDRVSKAFVCPGIMNSRLQFVKRAILIDACHRKSYGGTLYVATCYSANNEMYPIAVGLTSVNESEEGWTYFLSNLKKACPILSTEPDSSFIRGAEVLGFETQEEGVEVFESLQNGTETEQPAQRELTENDTTAEVAVHRNQNELADDEYVCLPVGVGQQNVHHDGNLTDNVANSEDVAATNAFSGNAENIELSAQTYTFTAQQHRTVTQDGIAVVDTNNASEINTGSDDDSDTKPPAVCFYRNGNEEGKEEVATNNIPVFETFDNNETNEEGTVSRTNAEAGEPMGGNTGINENEFNDGGDIDMDAIVEVPNGDENENVNNLHGTVGESEGETRYEGGNRQQNNSDSVSEQRDQMEMSEYDLDRQRRDMWNMIEHRSMYQWMLVSDRDKGMAKAVSKVLPNVHPTNCAVHIRRNVLNSYGLRAANMIPKIAACYLATDKELLFQELASINKEAEKYVRKIKPSLWRNTAFMDPFLPPRYGILSSNGVESANNMFSPAREGLWLDAIQSVLYDMSKKIMKRREEYEKKQGRLVCDKVYDILYDAFKSARSYEVTLTVDNTYIVRYRNANTTHGNMHKVVPSIAVCSCGEWHTRLLPCRHAMAWAREVHNWGFQQICDAMCSYVHKNQAGKELYSVGFDLVMTDNIRYDNVSLPNVVAKPAGRPSKQRIRPRNKNGRQKHSSRQCGRCKQFGHNVRTCAVETNNLIGQHSVN